jgi:hypothetical protein
MLLGWPRFRTGFHEVKRETSLLFPLNITSNVPAATIVSD